MDLDNENNFYNQIFSVFEYYIKTSYNFIINFYELDQHDINKLNSNESNSNESNSKESKSNESNSNESNSNIVNNDIDEANIKKLCIIIGNSLLEDSYEIVYEDNIDKEL
jgi:hypothetical protein